MLSQKPSGDTQPFNTALTCVMRAAVDVWTCTVMEAAETALTNEVEVQKIEKAR